MITDKTVILNCSYHFENACLLCGNTEDKASSKSSNKYF